MRVDGGGVEMAFFYLNPEKDLSVSQMRVGVTCLRANARSEDRC